MDKRGNATAVAQLDLGPCKKLDQPGIDLPVLGRGCATRLGTGCNRRLKRIGAGVYREVSHNAKVPAEITDHCGLESSTFLVEVLGNLADRRKLESVVVGFDGGIAGKGLKFRVGRSACILGRSKPCAINHQKYCKGPSSHSESLSWNARCVGPRVRLEPKSSDWNRRSGRLMRMAG